MAGYDGVEIDEENGEPLFVNIRQNTAYSEIQSAVDVPVHDYADIQSPKPRARPNPRKAILRDRDLRLKMFTRLRMQLPRRS